MDMKCELLYIHMKCDFNLGGNNLGATALYTSCHNGDHLCKIVLYFKFTDGYAEYIMS